MDSELSDEFEVKVCMHQGSVLSPFLIAVVVDVHPCTNCRLPSTHSSSAYEGHPLVWW